MAKIHILNEQLTNKIAAGEVVQRPASLIKELVENSIDAGATEITIVLRNGGKSLAQVIDNGEGMSRDDLMLAFERYATSKIASVDDLQAIRTLGFRGEALASIAAVSIVEATSTLAAAETGEQLKIEGGVFRSILPVAPVPGTSILVKNLFYNIPARRKFLKTKEAEFRQIVDIIRKFALIHPEIRFILHHDGKLVFNLAAETSNERIGHLFTPDYPANLLAIRQTQGDYTLSGVIGNLNLVRARRGDQFLYVNKRFITDRLMNHAIATAYGGLISRGEYPFYVLNIEMPCARVDVNVHPMKMEVKFEDESWLYNFIRDSVGEGLREVTGVIPSLDRFSPDSFYSPPSIPRSSTPELSPDGRNESSTGRSTQADQPVDLNRHFSQRVDGEIWLSRAERFSQESGNLIKTENPIDIAVYQIHNKYIVSQVRSGMVLIDQHVAHERILYEEALTAMTTQDWKAQQLLFPQVIELSLTDFSALLEILPFLEKLGFRIRQFGKQTIIVDAVPAGIRWGNEKKIIQEILDYYHEFGGKDRSIQERVAASYACKAAIKSGDALTQEEMRNLVDRLFATRNPYFVRMVGRLSLI